MIRENENETESEKFTCVNSAIAGGHGHLPTVLSTKVHESPLTAIVFLII